jgi:hypothetical protein
METGARPALLGDNSIGDSAVLVADCRADEAVNREHHYRCIRSLDLGQPTGEDCRGIEQGTRDQDRPVTRAIPVWPTGPPTREVKLSREAPLRSWHAPTGRAEVGPYGRLIRYEPLSMWRSSSSPSPSLSSGRMAASSSGT